MKREMKDEKAVEAQRNEERSGAVDLAQSLRVSLSFPLIHFGLRQQRVRQIWLCADKHNQHTNISSAIRRIPGIDLCVIGLFILGEKNTAANINLSCFNTSEYAEQRYLSIQESV